MSTIFPGWDKFTKRIIVNADINKVYRAWTSKTGIESWFLRESVFSRNGNDLLPEEQVKKEDTYKWLWHGYGDDIVEYGKILDANEKDMLQFTFTGNCIVTVKIYKRRTKLLQSLHRKTFRKTMILKPIYMLVAEKDGLFILLILNQYSKVGLISVTEM